MPRCMTPFTVKDSKYGNVPVPCGKCPFCVKRRVSQWSFRLMQEEKVSHSAHFITLTYNTDFVPISPSGYMTVQKRDLQLFMKRLRKLNKRKIKYYFAAEYGGKTNRPHYHGIIFNCDVDTIDRAWYLGSVHYGTVTGASVGYTLKYMSKRGRIPMHANDDRVPEFSLMSLGLGKSYVTIAMQKWHSMNLSERMLINVGNGKVAAMPRYYKRFFYSEDQLRLINFWHTKRADYEYKRFWLQPNAAFIQRDIYEAYKAAFINMANNAVKLDRL